MIQRFERRSPQEMLSVAKQELLPHFQQLAEIPYENLASSDSADIIISMINELSHPNIGIQLISHTLAEAEFPYQVQYDMIFQKAETFYLQSIMQDLNRVKNDEPIMQISKEEIRQCVEELNWKINIQHSSVLNKSQQVGENIDLMKFFEGVRNYQNWNENIKRESLERLKEKAHNIQLELTLKKGFITSKIEKIITQAQQRSQFELFDIAKQRKAYERNFNVFRRIVQRKQSESMDIIRVQSQIAEEKIQQLQRLFKFYNKKRCISDLRRIAFDIKDQKDSLNRLISLIVEVKRKKQIILKVMSLRQMNIKPMIKASKITEGIQWMMGALQKVSVRHILKQLDFSTKTIFQNLNRGYMARVKGSFIILKEHNLESLLSKPNVSDRIKGKILVSLDKHEKEPINLKKTFDKWYLNTHQQKFSKKVYNIWLQGNTSKFTFFMRLKNMCDLVNKQMISKEMKNFIKILCEKYGKYETHNQKTMLIRWVEKVRKIRKIQKMFNLLTDITQETKDVFEKHSVEKIIGFCKKRQIVNKYLSKYLLSFIQKRQQAFENWVNVNNIKKQWGRRKMRKLLLQITSQMKDTARDTLNVFKLNLQEGQQKKRKQCRRTINTDILFISTFFHVWRFNEVTDKAEQKMAVKTIIENKTKSISQIALTNSKVVSSNLKDIIFKFKQHKQMKSRRIDVLKNKFMKVVQDNEESLLKETVKVMVDCWREGKIKKERLVTKLVHSIFVKEKLALSIMKNKSHHIKDLIKIEKCSKICEIIQNKIKENLKIFNKRLFVMSVLQKIVSNRASNIGLALDFWKAMPLRMRWKLRQKIIKMSDTIQKLSIDRLNACQNEFINCLVVGKTKKKKGVYIMANQFETVVRKNFRKYHGNALKLKQSHQNDIVDKIFESIRLKSQDNFQVIMKGTPEWPLKGRFIEKLDGYLKNRVKSFFLTWNSNAKALTLCNKIVDEKKKRVLENLNQLLIKGDFYRTRKTIEAIDKTRRIHNLQLNFLKKLCEGQAGKILKGFMIWKSMPAVQNKEKIMNATTFSSNLHQLLMKNLKFPLKIFQHYRKMGAEKRYQGMNRLVASKCSEISKCFHKWLLNKRLTIFRIKNNKVETVFNAILKAQSSSYSQFFTGEETKNKIRSLQIIEHYWDEQKRYCIKKWQTNNSNLKIRDIERKHVLTSMNDLKEREERKRIINEAVVQFKANREARLLEKKKNKVQSIIKILQNEEAFKRTLLNETVDKLKYNHYRGNFLKNQIFHKFLREKIGQVHSYLSIWNGRAMQKKEIHRQRIVTTNFDSVNESIRNAFKIVFARGRELMIKKGALTKIFSVQSIKYKGFFNLWRQRVKQLKILGQMDKQAKASILQRINKIVNATSTNTVIDTIKKFHMNFKIQRVQRKFIDRLLQTKSGKVIHAFNSWKTIPYNQKMSKFKKYQKFYFDMESFYKKRLKTVHMAFTDSQDDGNLMKKQSILKLFQMTSLGIRRFYNRWTRLTKEKHTLLQVHKTFQAFESVEGALANQYQIIFQDERAYRIKISAINKLIAASRGTTQNYFSIWRQKVKLINIERSMDKQSKKLALGIFNKVIGNSSTGQVIGIINKFKKNASMTKIGKAFFNRLMQTKTGKVIQFFQKLKTVPDAKLNKRKKKGIIFESRLHSLTQKRLRYGLAPFKDSTYDANIKKKYCLDRLMRACMGENKKKFLIWRNVVREGKILKHTELCENIFSNIENIYRNNFKVINKNTSSQIQKKKGLCRKLINNSLFVQHHAYMLWKEAYHIDDIKIQAKQNNTQSHLRNLFQIFKEHQNKKTVQTIDVFRRTLESENNLQQNYYKDYMNQKCLEFYNTLKARQLTNKNILITALKANKAQSALGEKSKRMLDVFQSILKVTSTSMKLLLKTEDQTSFLSGVLSKIYHNQWNNMRATLNQWKVNKTAIEYQQDNRLAKKREALSKLSYHLLQNQQTRIKQTVKQFLNNFKVKEMKKKMCVKIFMTKSQKHRSSFMNWKKLPYQQAKKTKSKAIKFQKRLLNFMTSRLKQVNDKLKGEGLQGIGKKENAVRNIVKTKLMELYSLFFTWRKKNHENKVKDKIVSLDKIFAIAQSAFKENVSIFEGSKVQDQRKIRTATQIFNNNVSKLKSVFQFWRKSARTIKLQQFDKCMRHFNPQDFNKRLMKQCFMMIEKFRDMQTMKGYINSLWKWKMSNIQATYYSKFIKVFKESEEMVKFSNVLNKKIYEHVHTGFRSILTVGSERTNRKRQIVVKYLTKRLRNYFIDFKNGTSKTEINVWKSKYTDSIKSKILHDIFFSLILKEKFYSLNKLKGYLYYTDNTARLIQTLNVYESSNMKYAFKKILWSGHTTLINLASELSSKVEKSVLKESFEMINQFKKISKLIDVLSSTISKNLLQKGFGNIKARKQKSIKNRLSIILLETIISQKKKDEKRSIIQSFIQNRAKNVSFQKIYKILSNKYESYARSLIDNGEKMVCLNKILLRFKRGQALQKILEKQDESLKKNYLNRMRKKSNIWMQLAIQRFATRASIRSSPAISLWRLKTYVRNT